MKQTRIGKKVITMYKVDDELIQVSIELHWRMRYFAITLFKICIEIDW